jgi:DNA repair protein RecO
MLVTTDAIVLRARKHGETSKIVSLYSCEFGKIDVIAKGARDIKSKFGGTLEAFAETRVLFYKKERADPGLYLLSKADLLRSNSKLLGSLEHIEAATSIIELVVRSMHDEEENRALYNLLSTTLRKLDEVEVAALDAIVFYFEVQFAQLLGFQIVQDEAAGSGGVHFRKRWVFKVNTGEVLEIIIRPDARPDSMDEYLFEGIPLEEESRIALDTLRRTTLEQAAQLRLSEKAAMNLKEVFRAYFIEHLPGVSRTNLRSAGVFGKLS